MKSKTDKRSSLDHVMHYIDRKAEFGKTIPVANAKRAAQYAFNSGRESVVENVPKLKWVDDLNITDDFEEVYREECIATTPFGEYSIRYFYYNKTYALFFADEKVPNEFKLLNDIKLFAEKDYQNRIKQALGL